MKSNNWLVLLVLGLVAGLAIYKLTKKPEEGTGEQSPEGGTASPTTTPSVTNVPSTLPAPTITQFTARYAAELALEFHRAFDSSFAISAREEVVKKIYALKDDQLRIVSNIYFLEYGRYNTTLWVPSPVTMYQMLRRYHAPLVKEWEPLENRFILLKIK